MPSILHYLLSCYVQTWKRLRMLFISFLCSLKQMKNDLEQTFYHISCLQKYETTQLSMLNHFFVLWQIWQRFQVLFIPFLFSQKKMKKYFKFRSCSLLLANQWGTSTWFWFIYFLDHVKYLQKRTILESCLSFFRLNTIIYPFSEGFALRRSCKNCL